MRLKRLIPTITACALLLAAAPASASPMDPPWTGSGTGATSVVSNGSSADPEFTYSVSAFSGSWEFRATAGASRSLPVHYDYSGYHSFFQVRVSLSRFVIRDGVQIVSQTLVNAGPANCCSPPSGGFSYQGDTTFDLRAGDIYGFRMSGSNGDSARYLGGTLKLHALDATPPDVAAVVDGTKGEDGWYTSDVAVHWTATDGESAISATTGCADASVTSDTAGRTFTCSATSEGGTTTRSVTIKRDATAPSVTVPGARVAEATGPGGATVSYDASATDGLDPSPAVSCSPASGSQFALGTHEVTCTATDAAGNAGSASFPVTVQDTTAPTLDVPADRTVNATSPAGAAVSWSAGADDIVDGAVDVTCAPSSGSTFAIGDTPVTCGAHDAAGNAASRTFSVHVKSASEQIADLGSAIGASTLPAQTATSAVKLLDDATAALAAGTTPPACGKLGAVANKILAKSGKDITAVDAAALIGDLDRIRAVAGCQA